MTGNTSPAAAQATGRTGRSATTSGGRTCGCFPVSKPREHALLLHWAMHPGLTEIGEIEEFVRLLAGSGERPLLLFKYRSTLHLNAPE